MALFGSFRLMQRDYYLFARVVSFSLLESQCSPFHLFRHLRQAYKSFRLAPVFLTLGQENNQS